MKPIKKWILAARPKTLFASIVPVAVGAALAKENFQLFLFGVILLDALLLQIASNFCNDVSDFEKGADTSERKGPLRAVQAGLISPQQMKVATLVVMSLATVLGAYLVYVGGVPILLIGLAALACAVLYTAGPRPFAYHGLGEVFVILFFGIIAVSGTYYLFVFSVSVLALCFGLAIGLLSSAILVVNNLRDLEEDRKNSKNTLAVRFGAQFSKLEYVFLLVAAALIPAICALLGYGPMTLLIVPAYLLAAPSVIKRVWNEENLNEALASTGKLLALYGLLSVLVT